VLHVCAFHPVLTPADPIALGHHRLWVNGIHHGDISPENLMYGVSAETNDPVGILNDFDLATWVDHSTTNNNRTGTLPFMAIDLLDGELEDRIPQLYRHDLESFSWVLAYITVADREYRVNIEDKTCTIELSPSRGVCAWFTNNTEQDRHVHVMFKRLFYKDYGMRSRISYRYFSYYSIIKCILQHLSNSHESLRNRGMKVLPVQPGVAPVRRQRVISEPEPDDPAKSLELLVEGVRELLGEGGDCVGFSGVEALLEVI
jgi:serine/threonine protein kinase